MDGLTNKEDFLRKVVNRVKNSFYIIGKIDGKDPRKWRFIDIEYDFDKAKTHRKREMFLQHIQVNGKKLSFGTRWFNQEDVI